MDHNIHMGGYRVTIAPSAQTPWGRHIASLINPRDETNQ